MVAVDRRRICDRKPEVKRNGVKAGGTQTSPPKSTSRLSISSFRGYSCSWVWPDEVLCLNSRTTTVQRKGRCYSLLAPRSTFHVPTRFQRWLPKQIPPAWPCRLSSAQYSVFMYHPARKRVPGAVEGVVEVASRKGEEVGREASRRRVKRVEGRGKAEAITGNSQGAIALRRS